MQTGGIKEPQGFDVSEELFGFQWMLAVTRGASSRTVVWCMHARVVRKPLGVSMLFSQPKFLMGSVTYVA